MIIDTKEEASTLWKTKNFVAILCLVFAVGIFLPIDQTLKLILTILCCVQCTFFLIFFLYQYNMRYTYIYFSNNSKNLVFRFYSLRNFHGKPQTIEMPKISFVKYEIVTDFFNKRESIVLYQKTPKGIAKYPPISLTLLSKKQKTDLMMALEKIEN